VKYTTLAAVLNLTLLRLLSHDLSSGFLYSRGLSTSLFSHRHALTLVIGRNLVRISTGLSINLNKVVRVLGLYKRMPG